MKEKNYMRWKKYRKFGKLRFSLLWGLYFSMLMTIIPFISDAIKNKLTFEINEVLIRGVTSALLGILIGGIRWGNNERDYEEYVDKKNSI